jgi:predicted amidophosphoribosyltransferase
MDNVAGIFRLTRPEAIAGKHILLIDDVTTTGATLTSCAKELAKAPDTRISILTLAVAARTPIPATDADNIEFSVFGLPLME